LQDRKTKRPITNRRNKMKEVEVLILGRKAKAKKTKLEIVESIKDGYYCPVKGCKNIMINFFGIHRCYLHGYFVPETKS